MPLPRPDVYAIESQDLEKLRAMSKRLQAGSDRERDEGHRLWLVVNTIEMNGAVRDIGKAVDTLQQETSK